MKPVCIWESYDALGESPLWHFEREALFWIDMKKPFLHCLNPKSNTYTQIKTLEPLVGILCFGENELIGISGTKIILINLNTHKFEILKHLKYSHNNIVANDVKCDKKGQLWISTKDIDFKNNIAGIYLLKNNGDLHLAVNGIIVGNGFGWSPDEKIAYLSDTLSRRIYQFDLDIDQGKLFNKKNYVESSPTDGYPDGFAVDHEGGVWVAYWISSQIIRYDSAGKIDFTISLPAKNITSCCFGGDDMKSLFVTTASISFGEQNNLGNQAGCLFEIRTNVPGLQISKNKPIIN